jgi:hypothetical protein
MTLEKKMKLLERHREGRLLLETSLGWFLRNLKWWHTPVISVSQEVYIEGSWSRLA